MSDEIELPDPETCDHHPNRIKVTRLENTIMEIFDTTVEWPGLFNLPTFILQQDVCRKCHLKLKMIWVPE